MLTTLFTQQFDLLIVLFVDSQSLLSISQPPLSCPIFNWADTSLSPQKCIANDTPVSDKKSVRINNMDIIFFSYL